MDIIYYVLIVLFSLISLAALVGLLITARGQLRAYREFYFDQMKQTALLDKHLCLLEELTEHNLMPLPKKNHLKILQKRETAPGDHNDPAVSEPLKARRLQ